MNSSIKSILVASLLLAAVGCGPEDDSLTDEELDATEDALGSDYPGSGGYLHLWDDNGYSDTHQQRRGYDSNLGNDGFNDKASSLVNKTRYYWTLFEDSNYGGNTFCIRPRSHIKNLNSVYLHPSLCSVAGGVVCKSWGDCISSLRKASTTGCAETNHVEGTPN